MSRRSYTKEFKLRTLQMIEESRKSTAQVAKELGISNNLIYAWRQKERDKEEDAFINETQLTAEQQEIKRLKAENARLKEEREILKKATAFFAKESK